MEWGDIPSVGIEVQGFRREGNHHKSNSHPATTEHTVHTSGNYPHPPSIRAYTCRQKYVHHIPLPMYICVYKTCVDTNSRKRKGKERERKRKKKGDAIKTNLLAHHSCFLNKKTSDHI